MQADYFVAWDAGLDQRHAPHGQQYLSTAYVSGFRTFIDRGPMRRPAGMAARDVLALHSLEAKIRHELDTKWSGCKDEAIGAIEAVASQLPFPVPGRP